MEIINTEACLISEIRFHTLSNSTIKEMSVLGNEGVITAESYNNNEPTVGGLVDTRLGTTDNSILCATCGLDNIKCPGHSGHLEMAAKVYNMAFFKIIKNVADCVCLNCSKVLLVEGLRDAVKYKKGRLRLADIKRLVKNVKTCWNCNKIVPTIKKDNQYGKMRFIAEYTNEDKTGDKTAKREEILTATKMYAILRNMSDADIDLLGFNSEISGPKDFIIKYFPFPPVAIRPSVKGDFIGRGVYDNDLTIKLLDIVKTNMRYKKILKQKEQENNLASYFDNQALLLQYHVATYFDNTSINIPKSEQKNGRQIISISSRIKGKEGRSKEGRIRHNLMGKRVNYSGRTVITSDPNLKIDEVGVPVKMAMNLTFPEVVTEYTIDRLSKLVKNGRDNYPGANYVIVVVDTYNKELGETKKMTCYKDLKYIKHKIELKYGDIVERHMLDGDPVIINRQPTLHRMGMMCHKAKIINNPNYNTLRINASVTKPYNADQL